MIKKTIYCIIILLLFSCTNNPYSNLVVFYPKSCDLEIKSNMYKIYRVSFYDGLSEGKIKIFTIKEDPGVRDGPLESARRKEYWPRRTIFG